MEGNRKQRWEDRAQMLWLKLTLILGGLSLAVVGAVLGLYLFVRLAYQVATGGTQRFDVAVLAFFRARQPAWFHEPLMAVTWLGNGEALVAVVALSVVGFVLARRFWPDAVMMLVASAGGWLLLEGLKWLFGRPRPEEGMFRAPGYSFPSGHAFLSLVVYGMLAYRLTTHLPKRRRWVWGLLLTLSVLVGLSRVLLGVHYPSDVAAGFAAAVPWLWACLALPGLWGERPKASPEERLERFRKGRAQLKEASSYLPSLTALAGRLAGDARVPPPRKAALWLAARYLALPVNLIPNGVPLLGVADDLLLAGAALGWALRSVPPEVAREHWDGGVDLAALREEVRQAFRNLLDRA